MSKHEVLNRLNELIPNHTNDEYYEKLIRNYTLLLVFYSRNDEYNNIINDMYEIVKWSDWRRKYKKVMKLLGIINEKIV